MTRKDALRQPCESAGEALRRIERRPDFLSVSRTDEYQQLMRDAAREASEWRRRSQAVTS